MEKSQFHLQAQLDYLYERQPRQLPFRATSAEDFQVWKQQLRAKAAALLGIAGRPLPATISAEQVQAIDRGSYVEEKYALDVGDHAFAPMYVLVPKVPPPYKAIMAFHGHAPSIQYILGNYPEGYTLPEHLDATDAYARAFAEAGYLVVAVEQRGFGERVAGQFGTFDHYSSCRQLSFDYLLKGRTMVGERCRDGMIALNYLQTRSDVIPGAVGCMGHSGGGTTTLWLSALDDRIKVAAVTCYLCSFRQSILGVPHCECNYVPHILEYAEMGDLAAMIAPRPLLAVAREQDPIFPIDGVRDQCATIQKAYDLLGVSERCALAVAPGDHDYYHPPNLEWFKRWL